MEEKVKKYEVEVVEVYTCDSVKVIKYVMEDDCLSRVLYRTVGEVGLNAGLKEQSADIIWTALGYIKENVDKINLINEIFTDSDIYYEDVTYKIIKVTCDQEVLYEINTETIKL